MYRRAQMYSCSRTQPPSWVTWMLARLLKKVSDIRRLALLITLVQKYGAISLMMRNRIYGRSVVFCMKWSRWSHLFVLRTWQACISACWKVQWGANCHRNLSKNTDHLFAGPGGHREAAPAGFSTSSSNVWYYTDEWVNRQDFANAKRN